MYGSRQKKIRLGARCSEDNQDEHKVDGVEEAERVGITMPVKMSTVQSNDGFSEYKSKTRSLFVIPSSNLFLLSPLCLFISLRFVYSRSSSHRPIEPIKVKPSSSSSSSSGLSSMLVALTSKSTAWLSYRTYSPVSVMIVSIGWEKSRSLLSWLKLGKSALVGNKSCKSYERKGI